MGTINWKQFTLRVPIQVPAYLVFNAWTSQDALESWFLRSAVFTDKNGKTRSSKEIIQPGDRFEWKWHGYDDNTKDLNSIIDNNGKDHLKFWFADRCIVTVTVKEEAGETICELTQEMTMDEIERQQYFYTDCGQGWTMYLLNLKSILEGGIDLRNRNMAIRKVVNA